ncbi:MAG: hypothetical protein C4290_09865 [Chloroflexota bacterium]
MEAFISHGSRTHRPMSTLSRRALLVLAGTGTLTVLLGRDEQGRARPLLGDDEEAGAQAGSNGGQEQQPTEPTFSRVEEVGPWEVLLYLAGRHPRYPGANLDSMMGFSAADILETMDTDVLDTVAARRGEAAVAQLYRLIAHHLLDTLLVVYGEAPVLLALDAGHGGLRGVYFDPGANGTEWYHTRRVVEAVEALAAEPAYASITIRRIFNDAIGDDFGLPERYERHSATALVIRNARAAMLAYEADAWNRQHPDRAVAVHVISVHFNVGSGGILVLHQGEAVPDMFRERSVAYARVYLNAARAALNQSGLLPYPLRLALGTGLSHDRLLYDPPYRLTVNPLTGVDRSKLPRRYAMLQASLLERDYADGALRYHGLV